MSCIVHNEQLSAICNNNLNPLPEAHLHDRPGRSARVVGVLLRIVRTVRHQILVWHPTRPTQWYHNGMRGGWG